MNKFLAGVDVGRKNIVFGVVLFLVLGIVAGVPLTVDLFGGSMLTESQSRPGKSCTLTACSLLWLISSLGSWSTR